MIKPTYSRTRLKMENARTRLEQTTAEREDVRQLHYERTVRLRALRLARDIADEKAEAKTQAIK